MNMSQISCLLCLFYLLSTVTGWKGFSDEPWDLDGPCQKYVEVSYTGYEERHSQRHTLPDDEYVFV